MARQGIDVSLPLSALLRDLFALLRDLRALALGYLD